MAAAIGFTLVPGATRWPSVGDKLLDGRDLTPLLKSGEVAWPERLLFSTWAGLDRVVLPTELAASAARTANQSISV